MHSSGGKQQVQMTFKIIAFSISNCHRNSLFNAINTKNKCSHAQSHTEIVKDNSAQVWNNTTHHHPTPPEMEKLDADLQSMYFRENSQLISCPVSFYKRKFF